MWIELSDEVENYICKIKDSTCNDAIAINNLLNSMIEGKHIVYLTRNLIDKLNKLKYIDKRNKDYYKWVKQKYINIYGASNMIEYKIKVIINKDNIFFNEDYHEYEVPLKFFYDCRETKLITEKETDGKFFINIYHYITSNKGSNWYNIKFENDSCHGSNITSKLNQIVNENDIAICILDSDQEMIDSKKGDTYKGANKIFKQNKNNHLIHLEALKVREKENLFPPSIYILFCENKKNFLKALIKFEDKEELIGFFDIKDGVKYKKHNITRWKEYYKLIINELKYKKIYKMPKSKMDKDFVCVGGIGDKLCDKIVEIMLENKCSFKTKPNGISETNIKLIQRKYNERRFLPEYMLNEWKRISKLLFSWGCCINKNKKPIYET